jgi:hypothetical protein
VSLNTSAPLPASLAPPLGHHKRPVAAGICHAFLAVIVRSLWAPLACLAVLASAVIAVDLQVISGGSLPVVTGARHLSRPPFPIIAGARSSWISVMPALSGRRGHLPGRHHRRQVVAGISLAPPFRSSQAPGCRRHLVVVGTSRASLPATPSLDISASSKASLNTKGESCVVKGESGPLGVVKGEPGPLGVIKSESEWSNASLATSAS